VPDNGRVERKEVERLIESIGEAIVRSEQLSRTDVTYILEIARLAGAENP
jgi:hypothetical protein